ncbi:DsbC family protein [Acinetobacter colistiniresistens]|uniref:Thiol:disulfide interchange protein n=1 Tax=Acinetobacter colistiniresistens TaxID=280145 RepID=A0A558FPU3_9GAMM|nr:DsbC family protein [Acinetobacter colistiniresistens]TVT87527.1 DsbC family protein [Acinetobacter colistiniresistens]
MKITIKTWLSAITLSLFGLQTLHADSKALEQNFKKNYPDIPVTSVSASPLPGIYEVYAAGKIIYTDETAKYLFFGNLLDVKNKKNLTEDRLSELTKIDVKQLPLDQAIKYVKGKGERILYVFSDPDCPYCQKLEQHMTSVDNVTVYLFLFPLKRLHPQAEAVANKIWCAKNQYEAWEDYMLHRKAPKNTTQCETPIQKNLVLGQKLQIDGTPTLFLQNGTRLSGSPQNAEQIEQLLQEASSKK